MPFSIGSPSSTNRTLWLSHAVRISSSTLSGPVCRTIYMGTGDGAGRALTRLHNAFTPPAEAPTTITRHFGLMGTHGARLFCLVLLLVDRALAGEELLEVAAYT